MNTSLDSQTPPVGPIAMDFHSNVKSDIQVIANLSQVNVRPLSGYTHDSDNDSTMYSTRSDIQDFVNVETKYQFQDFLREIRIVARLRRARFVRMRAAAQYCLVLTELEASLPARKKVWEEQASSITESIRNQLINLTIDSKGMYDAYKVVITREIERVILLWISLREQGSWTGVSATIGQYLLSHFDGSVLLTLKQVFDDYFSCLQPHAGESWLELLKLSHTNWKLATQNEGFQHVTKALSMLVGAGMIQATDRKSVV